MKKVNFFLIFISLSFFTHAFGQNYTRTLKEFIYVNSNVDSIELNFTKPGLYKIAVGESPKDINWSNSIVTNNSKITFKRDIPRPFYGVITANNDTLIVAERKLIIADLANFRDLGGIKTTEGRHIVWGRFYRSDALSELLTAEFPYVEDLKVGKVFDLRTEAEIEKAKDNIPKNIIYEHFPIFSDKEDGMIAGLGQSLALGKLTKQKAEDIFVKMYVSFAKDDTLKFNNLLHQVIIADNYPNIFHCTTGKDRTGYTAAMILALLKVDRQTILDEYEMTNFYTQKLIRESAQAISKLGYGDKISPDVAKVLMSVNKKFLEASFDYIDKNYGGMDAYIKNQLGFSDEERAKLIAEFTY